MRFHRLTALTLLGTISLAPTAQAGPALEQSVNYEVNWDNAADAFSTAAYNNDNGFPLSWATDWIEVDDADVGTDPSSGDIYINNHDLYFNDASGGTAPTLEREVDLSGYTYAIVSFYLQPTGLEASDAFNIEVSDDGGGSWNLLEKINAISGSANLDRSYDISAYIASDTRIRLGVDNQYNDADDFMRVEFVNIYATTESPPVTLPSISGGTSQTYVLFVTLNGTDTENAPGDVTAVSGGGLTWTQRAEQCAFDSQRRKRNIEVWTAQGSPAAFQAQVTYENEGNSHLALLRYSGVDGLEDFVSANADGESAACTSTNTQNATAELALTSTVDGSLHLIGVNNAWKPVQSTTAGYTSQYGDASQYPQARLSIYDKVISSASSETFQANLQGNIQWVAAGLVLNPIVPDHFVIDHDGTGTNCLPEAIEVDAVDGGGTPVAYTGTVTLDTGTGKGTWALTSGSGTFNDATANDGIATYTYDSSDNGHAEFTLDHQEGTILFNITASDGAITDDNTEGNIYFVPDGFSVTTQQLSTTGGPPYDPSAYAPGTATAGDTETLWITAYGQDPTDGTCGIIEAYTGNQKNYFWYGYVNPNTGTLAPTINGTTIGTGASPTLFDPIVYTNGEASVSVKYKDVGDLRINVQDPFTQDPDTSAPQAAADYTWIPDDFVITAITEPDLTANPGATTPTGTIFVDAGDPFYVTVEVRDSEGDVTPNYGNESSAEGITLTPTLVAPTAAGGPFTVTAGNILNATAFSATSAGIFRNTTTGYDEVGAITLAASVGDGDYLGAGDVTGTSSGNVGRFKVDYYTPGVADGWSVGLTRLVTECTAGGFTYLGQEFEFSSGYLQQPLGLVHALAADGSFITNIWGDASAWNRLTSVTTRYTWQNGDVTLSETTLNAPTITVPAAATIYLLYDSEPALTFTGSDEPPFDAEISLEIDVTDADGTDLIGYNSDNTYYYGDVTAPYDGVDEPIVWTAGAEFRDGRMAFVNAHGSEMHTLTVPFRAEYYHETTEGWLPNTVDTCTTVNTDNLTLTPTPGGLSSTATFNSNTSSDESLQAGDGDLELSAPGEGNTGNFALSYDLSADSLEYLRYPWTWGGGDADPDGLATFGIFKGRDEMVWTRESY